MQLVAPLESGCFYHIYNRGNNRDDLFRGERDYRHFLERYAHHTAPVMDTYAYCLMRNHFHLLVRVKTEQEWRSLLVPEFQNDDIVFNPTQGFSNFFNAYAKWFNNAHRRTGSLFEERFKRIAVTTDNYFTTLIFYIHFNPQKHHFVDNFRDWPWSSFTSLMGNKPTKLQRQGVLDWFDGRERFGAFHQGAVDERAIATLIEDDFE